MKKLLIFVLTGIFPFTLSLSQNVFVYVRYNPESGNSSAVVSKIEQIRYNTKGRCVVFLSMASHPMIAENDGKWNEIRSHILTTQVSSDYYADEENAILNNCFQTAFEDRMSDDLHIKGNDNSWECNFILSEYMYNSESEKLCLMLMSNELFKRMHCSFYVYNEKGEINELGNPNNKMFKIK